MKWVPLVVLLLGATLWSWRQYHQRTALQQELEQLEQKLKMQMSSGQDDKAAASTAATTIDTNELEQLRADHREVLRLRGEIGGLRERGRLTRENLERRIEQARVETEAAQRETELVEARQQAARASKEALNLVRGYADTARNLAIISNSPLPKSWEEARQLVERPFQITEQRSAERAERIREAFRMWFTRAARDTVHSLDAFELLPVPETLDLSRPDGGRGILLLRERGPRLQPDGGWARAYAFANGEVREAKSDTPDFTEWERKVRADAGQ